MSRFYVFNFGINLPSLHQISLHCTSFCLSFFWTSVCVPKGTKSCSSFPLFWLCLTHLLLSGRLPWLCPSSPSDSPAQRLCCFARTLLTSPMGFSVTDVRFFRPYSHHEGTGECSISSPIESGNTVYFFQVPNFECCKWEQMSAASEICSVGKNYTDSHFNSSSNGSWFILQRATQLTRLWSGSSSFDGVERLVSQLDCINYFSVPGTEK